MQQEKDCCWRPCWRILIFRRVTEKALATLIEQVASFDMCILRFENKDAFLREFANGALLRDFYDLLESVTSLRDSSPGLTCCIK